MTEKSFYFSKKKQIPRVLIAGAIFLVCLQLLIMSLSSGYFGRIGILILVAIAGVLAALYLIASLPALLTKPSKNISFNSEGVYSSGNYGNDVGIVPWNHITRIAKNVIGGKNYICVYVNDIQPYLEKVKNKEKRNVLQNNKIALMIDNSNVAEEVKEILAEAEKFFDEYGSPSTSEAATAEVKSTPSENLKIPVLSTKVFMHYDSGAEKQKNFEDQGWMNQYVFFWDAHEAFDRKSLPDEFNSYQHRYFILAKELPKLLKMGVGKVMPWFGKPGNGDKYFLSTNNQHMPLKKIIDSGYFLYIDELDKANHVFHDMKNIFASVSEQASEISIEKEISLKEAIENSAVKIFRISK